tara:strand:+ start:369 stop:1916 length:1548 start_codon:yes stop_codon:yes gene_type:complete
MCQTIEKAHETLDNLWKEYEADPYMQNKILTHMCTHLPSLMSQASQCHKKREVRKRNLTEGADVFITQFLNKHDYYYSPVAGVFFHYDGNHYSIYNEDDILYEALRGVTHKPELHAWKYKIKNSIIKQVKERHLISCIPESATIQCVVRALYPNVFPNGTMAKYFLTAIGDGLFKKSDNAIYLISNEVKPFVQEIAAQANTIFGVNTISSSFKYKYYDHNFSECRLIDTQPTINQKIWETGFQKQIVDLLCVAAHYSKRYGSADGFAERYKEQATVQHIKYLTDKTNELLVEEFIDLNIQKHTQEGGSITYPEMVYLWKQHLVRKRIPNVIFNAPLRTTLLKLLSHNAETDSFTDVTSAQLPSAKMFMEFWDSQMVSNEMETHLEIDEIMTLLKHWNKKALNQMDAACILRTLRHFYTDVEVEDDKFIMHVECKLWSKKKHIDDFLTAFRAKCMDEQEEHGTMGAISLHKAYDAYNDFSKGALMMASKSYFERHLFDSIEEYIDENNCISSTWSS